jgi:hypothetical protein
MDRKGGSTAVVTAEEVRSSLKRVALAPTEERALRMRYGARVDPAAPLPTAYGDNEELGDELMLLEVRLLSALKRRNAAQPGSAGQAKVSRVSPARNATKDKIVAKLKARKR